MDNTYPAYERWCLAELDSRTAEVELVQALRLRKQHVSAMSAYVLKRTAAQTLFPEAVEELRIAATRMDCRHPLKSVQYLKASAALAQSVWRERPPAPR
jgi:hypothetical protein